MPHPEPLVSTSDLSILKVTFRRGSVSRRLFGDVFIIFCRLSKGYTFTIDASTPRAECSGGQAKISKLKLALSVIIIFQRQKYAPKVFGPSGVVESKVEPNRLVNVSPRWTA